MSESEENGQFIKATVVLIFEAGGFGVEKKWWEAVER